MIKKSRGVTLISLVVLIVLMLIITSTVVYRSMDSFASKELNDLYNDIALLEDRIAVYYSKYGTIPKGESYALPNEIQRDLEDDEHYYVIDLKKLGNLTLFYGEPKETGYDALDVYVINEKTHTIYYPKGITAEGITYYKVE